MKQHYCSPLTWTFIRGLRKTRLLPHLNFSVSMVLEGRQLIVPVNGGVGLGLLAKDEPWMVPLLRALLMDFQGVFVDVGVNVGQTLCKVKAIDPQRQYWGAEPNPICVHYSQELIRLHGYENATLVPVGLSDQNGLLHLELHSAQLDDSAATAVSNFRPRSAVHRKFIIPVMRFDSAAKDVADKRIGIVKIDVEGGEREVLLGLEERIRKDRPAIVLEILPAGDQITRLERQKDVESLFSNNQYILYRIRAAADGVQLQLMDSPIGVHRDQSLSNYLALPEECAKRTLSKLGS